ncbi:ABC transporter substrate-binding protein [Neorhizobium alkalisoli]|uniref:ABC transporter substrate-binding protein n=1 Tax=Neorhizobium alkalisoli TaxID=528178 RepID=UPI001FE100E7|nr:ABC transporter substrate-binding protein [Neorhizobium alkalisoli]
MLEEEALLVRSHPQARPRMADEVRLVHWWVSGGEAAALDVLKQNLAKEDLVFNDTPIAGGDKLKADLKAMIIGGDIPTAAVMSGYDTWNWAQQGVLADLSTLAAAEDWNSAVPAALQKFCKYNGKWIGVPVALHSINWLWINTAAAEKIGLDAPPASMDALFVALEQAKAAGLVPLAIGGQPWLMATLFDSVVVATNGLDFYKRAFVDLDDAALKSSDMIRAFQNLSRLSSYADPGYSRLNWNDATDMVITGGALLEISGDWAKAEYRSAKKKADVDYLCVRFPGTEDDVLFNADIIAMFDVEPDRQSAQTKLAKSIMDRAFQASFNDAKGAAPVRMDVPDATFDAFGKKALADVRAANSNGTLIGAMSHGYIQPTGIQQAYFDVVARVFRSEIRPEAAAETLAEAIAAVK